MTPPDLPAEALRMAAAFALVAAGAVPVGLLAWLVARRPGLPGWKHPRSPWSTADTLFLFVLQPVLPAFVLAFAGSGVPFEAAAATVGAAAGVAEGALDRQQAALLAAGGAGGGLLLLIAAVMRFATNPRLPSFSPRSWLGNVSLGVAAWFVLAPLTIAVHFATTWAAGMLGVEPQDHPLTRSDLADPRVVALFAAVVCGVTPLVEEFLYRGLLLGWSAQGRGRPAAVLTAAVVLAALFGGSMAGRFGAVGFALLLAAGALALRRRTSLAVYSTSALFAAAHSAVWPTPVPLFVLALGLGYLTARTGGIVASTVTHALFNAVSFVFLLRGG